MGMKDPIPTFSYIATQIRDRHPNFAYLHAIEPRVHGFEDRESLPNESNDFLRKIWAPKPFISAGGYGRSNGIERSEQTGDLIAYGRYFISNVRSTLLEPLLYDFVG
jgi:NADPH2 dehydrogenase